jgi:hypothetical protein
MSETWQAHIQRVNDLIAANPVQRYQPPPPPAPPPAPTWQDMLAQAGINPEAWGGEAMAGGHEGTQAAASGGGRGWTGGIPNSSTLASFMDINPGLARAGITGLGLLSGPLGMGLSAMNTLGNIGNTVSNTGMLNGLGVNPGFGSTIGGLLGFNGLAGNMTSALNAAMGNQYSGFSNLSPAQMPGDITGTSFAGLLGGLGPTHGTAPLGAVQSSPMVGYGDLSGGSQGGGYGGMGGAIADAMGGFGDSMAGAMGLGMGDMGGGWL